MIYSVISIDDCKRLRIDRRQGEVCRDEQHKHEAGEDVGEVDDGVESGAALERCYERQSGEFRHADHEKGVQAYPIVGALRVLAHPQPVP